MLTVNDRVNIRADRQLELDKYMAKSISELKTYIFDSHLRMYEYFEKKFERIEQRFMQIEEDINILKDAQAGVMDAIDRSEGL